MRKYFWIWVSVLPLLGHASCHHPILCEGSKCQNQEKESYSCRCQQAPTRKNHIAASDSCPYAEFEGSGELLIEDSLSSFEIDESDPSIDLWMQGPKEPFKDRVVFEDFQKNSYENEEFDEAFAYEIAAYEEKAKLKPTPERITTSRRQFFNKPRVVESKDSSYSEKRKAAKDSSDS